jgi:hypothetical protein
MMDHMDIRSLPEHNGTVFHWEAVAIHLLDDPEEPWHIFLTHSATDLWLTTGETESLPARFSVEEDFEVRVAKLIEAYGCEWEEIEHDPTGVVGLQCRAMDGLSEERMAEITCTPMEELREHREEMLGVSIGEALYARITGSHPLAVRN